MRRPRRRLGLLLLLLLLARGGRDDRGADGPRLGLVLARPRPRRPEAGQGVRHEALVPAGGGGGVVGGLGRRVVVDGGGGGYGVLVVRRLVFRTSPICGHERNGLESGSM